MTTATFRAQCSALARADGEIRALHCPAPNYRTSQAETGTIACPKCGKPLKYSMPANSWATSGTCATAGCLKWRN